MRSLLPSTSLVLLLVSALPLLAAAHGHDETEAMDMNSTMEHGHGSLAPAPDAGDYPESYYAHGEYGFWIMSHIVLMVAAWVFLMPVSIMLSVARSRSSIPSQVLFHLVNSLGMFAGIVYNSATPDLYAGNAHHPLGWVLTSLAGVWTVLSIFVTFTKRTNKAETTHKTHGVTAAAMAQYNRLNQYTDESRYSRDSGQGTERNSSSLFAPSRQNSSESIMQKEQPGQDNADSDYADEDHDSQGFLGTARAKRCISRRVSELSSPRLSKVVRFSQIVLEKFLLLLGFAALCTGFVTYGGLARGGEVFSIAAHFIKGGIFFWYGLLTLGRWMGAFSEFGWAWNIRPDPPVVSRWKSRIPSAEFTESFVIWFYGASNVFLEHLGNAGQGWSPQDFEHLSITFLFFGGGLLGMLIESNWARELANTTVAVQESKDIEASEAARYGNAEPEEWQQPSTYRIPLNPMPGLTIMLLGMMMSGHKQTSMVSTMMHAQWGGLFSAFALARAATYLILYLKPPTSHYPSRPPSELVAAFCLTSGGLMFMMSASDTVRTIESNGLDAMTVFTTTLGLTGMILAWEIAVFALKGWAVRRSKTVL